MLLYAHLTYALCMLCCVVHAGPHPMPFCALGRQGRARERTLSTCVCGDGFANVAGPRPRAEHAADR